MVFFFWSSALHFASAVLGLTVRGQQKQPFATPGTVSLKVTAETAVLSLKKKIVLLDPNMSIKTNSNFKFCFFQQQSTFSFFVCGE